MRPFVDKILVRKCITGEKVEIDGREHFVLGGIIITDQRGERQNWCKILDVGDGCKWFTKDDIGGFVILPENSYFPGAYPNSKRLGAEKLVQRDFFFRVEDGGDDFIVRESLFQMKDGAPAVVYFP